jgi:hypothetical protein
MDTNTALLIARYALTALGGVLVAHGYLSSGDWETASGAILTLVPIILGIIAHQQTKVAIVKAAYTGTATQATPLSAMTASPAAVAATLPTPGPVTPPPTPPAA